MVAVVGHQSAEHVVRQDNVVSAQGQDVKPQLDTQSTRQNITFRPSANGTRNPAAGETIRIKKFERAFYVDHRGLTHEVWQPGDGDGTPDDSVYSASLSSSWRFFTGPLDTTAESKGPPRFVILDDRSACFVLQSSLFAPEELGHFWKHDFAPSTGAILSGRPHRGAAAVIPGSNDVPYIIIRQFGRLSYYHFSGEQGGYGRFEFGCVTPRRLISATRRSATAPDRYNRPVSEISSENKSREHKTTTPRAAKQPKMPKEIRNWSELKGIMAGESETVIRRKRAKQNAWYANHPPAATSRPRSATTPEFLFTQQELALGSSVDQRAQLAQSLDAVTRRESALKDGRPQQDLDTIVTPEIVRHNTIFPSNMLRSESAITDSSDGGSASSAASNYSNSLEPESPCRGRSAPTLSVMPQSNVRSRKTSTPLSSVRASNVTYAARMKQSSGSRPTAVRAPTSAPAISIVPPTPAFASGGFESMMADLDTDDGTDSVFGWTRARSS